MTNFTRNALKAFALSAIFVGAAFSTNAQDKLYLTDVYTVEDLNSDIFGVPMRIDYVDGSNYVARYYNQKENNQVYILIGKTDFTNVYGDDGDGNGSLSLGGSLDEVSPIILPEANKYYQININTDDMEYSVSTYEVQDNMDPIFWELGDWKMNSWWDWEKTGPEEWIPADGAWMRQFVFGYTCTEYLINDNNEWVDQAGNVVDKENRVMGTTINPNGDETSKEQLRWVEPWSKDKTNPHLYVWDNPKHFVAGQKLNFIIHNWHEHGWWNYCTWRCDDEEECDIFYYYGSVVKKSYLDQVYGVDAVDQQKWVEDEGYRKQVIFGEGSDCWCKPTVQKTGEYRLYFDTHLGRARLVWDDGTDPAGVSSVAVDNTNVPVRYYNLMGMPVANPENGIFIKVEGDKASKVRIR